MGLVKEVKVRIVNEERECLLLVFVLVGVDCVDMCYKRAFDRFSVLLIVVCALKFLFHCHCYSYQSLIQNLHLILSLSFFSLLYLFYIFLEFNTSHFSYLISTLIYLSQSQISLLQ